eukprot:TRINITY_DN11220_c0_g1_i1.p1 TRINITY_DN11220_c0_g1~~TRINITY_DN11220_c0_g1_i1.p1  ORF type:complete len:410 (-),score=55.05 TRINITY_DN11220_c0_g1_i1:314-1543(-)
MVRLFVALSVLAVVFAAPRWFEISSAYDYDTYLQDFPRSHATDGEYSLRSSIFNRNIAAIRRHNSETSSWRAGVNQFTDWTSEEKKALLGVPRSLKHRESSYRRVNTSSAAAEHSLHNRATLPANFSWVGSGVLTAVKDQGQCGSCWAFASTATLESHASIQASGGAAAVVQRVQTSEASPTRPLVELAVQQLVSCAANEPKCGGWGGCAGSIADLAFEYVKKNGGMAAEWTYGYESYWGNTNGTCRYRNARGPGGTPPVVTVGGHVNVPSNDEAAVSSALVSKGPLAVNVDASSWFAYESGVFDGCPVDTLDINHVVQLVGYGQDGSERDAQRYWLIRNSWSGTWGESGFIKLRREASGKPPACAPDPTPHDGTGCLHPPGPSAIHACGACGVLYDAVYPTDVQMVGR